MFGSDDRTELQDQIVKTARRNPDAEVSEIASICDCSESYVRETLKEHSDLADELGIQIDIDSGLDDEFL